MNQIKQFDFFLQTEKTTSEYQVLTQLSEVRNYSYVHEMDKERKRQLVDKFDLLAHSTGIWDY